MPRSRPCPAPAPSDLQAALDACAAEPIHTPGAVQPWGALLVLDPDTFRVGQASANAPDLFGRPVAALLGAPLTALVTPDSAAAVGALGRDLARVGDGVRVVARVRPVGASGLVRLTAHRHDGLALLECYADDDGPARDGSDPTQATREFARMVGRGPAVTLEAFADRLAEEVRALTGYDRVMIYRFAEDGAGEVIAEARDAALEPFLGLWYPASDIPAQARTLYLRHRVRLLGDVDATPVPLVPAVHPATGRPTDLTHATLRAVSPVHLQYLRNMGVRATLVVSVVQDGRLWGLVSCHHRAPRWLRPEVLEGCDLLAELLSVQLTLLENTERVEAAARVHQATVHLRRAVAEAGDWPGALVGRAVTLLDVVDAGGAAVVRGADVWTVGRTPRPEDVQAIARWVRSEAPARGAATVDDSVVAEAALGRRVDALAGLSDAACGVLAFELADAGDAVVLWFRPEWVHTVTWGGAPQPKPVRVEDGAVRLEPRASFAAWSEEVRGTARPWTDAERTAAALLRTTLVDEVLHLLAYEHLRVQEDLRRVRQAVDAASEAMAIADPAGRIHFLNPAFARLFGADAEARPPRTFNLFDPPADGPDALGAARAALAAGRSWRAEVWLRVAGGERAPVDLRLDLIRDDAGRALGVVAAFGDLRARYREAEERRALQARVLESIGDAFFAVDRAWRFTYVNHEAERMLRRPREEVLGQELWACFPRIAGTEFERQYRRAVETGEAAAFTSYFAHHDAWFDVRAYPSPDGLSVYIQEATARQRALLALAEREAQFGAVVAHLPGAAVFLVGADGRVRVAEGEALATPALAAVRAGQLLAESLPPEAAAVAPYAEAALAGEARTGEVRVDGRIYGARAVPVPGVGGAAVGSALVLLTDVTAERGALDRLRLFEAAFEQLRDLVVITEADALDDPGPRITYVNAAVERTTGYTAAELLGRTPRLFQGPDTDRATLAAVRRALSHGEPCQVEVVNYHKNGTPYWLEMAIAPVADSTGGPTHFVAVERDITARKAQEAALRDSEERYRALSAAAPVGVFEADTDGRVTYANPRLGELWGVAPEAVHGLGWAGSVHPDDRAALLTEWRAALRAHREFEREYRLLRPDGGVRWVVARSAPRRDAAGRVTGVVGTVDDVTARRTMEDQLRQAQRMEAMGRLAGGVAHDFNNLLTVIHGNADFALGALAADDPVREDVGEIQRAAERAALLTRQLLAFSRKQVLQPRVVDAGEVVAGVVKLLHRVIGEDVRLATDLRAAPGYVVADPGQLERVLVNLAVNARDAMPNGGAVTIGTALMSAAALPPAGRRPAMAARGAVVLRVSDTGTGMDEATRARAFEPFFTTKAEGLGTGLGLATVYGIAEQSGGSVWIESAPGAGTTVWLALPAAEAAPGTPAPGAAGPPLASGRGVVLLAEDEAAVRDTTARVLRQAGYRVLAAANGREALDIWEAARASGDPIRALVSDVVMPEMGGRALAEALRRERADLPVVFVSGYALGGLGAEDPGGRTAFLEKPFAAADLLGRLEAALAGAAAH